MYYQQKRKVHVMIHYQRGHPAVYVDLCTQCLRKELNRTHKLGYNKTRKWRHLGPLERTTEYYSYPDYKTHWMDTTNLKCMKCGWIAKGRT